MNCRDHIVPAHHPVAEFLGADVALAGLTEKSDTTLWKNASGHARALTGDALTERRALDIVKRRCRAAALHSDISKHSMVSGQASRCTGMKRRPLARDLPDAAAALAYQLHRFRLELPRVVSTRTLHVHHETDPFSTPFRLSAGVHEIGSSPVGRGCS